VVAGHRQHIADAASLQLGPQLRVGAIDLVAVTQAVGTPASRARVSIWVARAGLVANPTRSGMPAARQRSGSSIQPRGTYSSRSIRACPASLAYRR
jgi:hypothetical protein